MTKSESQDQNVKENEFNKPSPNEKWEFKVVDSSSIVFKSGYKFDTHLYELKYIGQVPLTTVPFLIFSGRDCDQCDANIAIYIHQPDKPIVVENGQNRYEYPGTLRDYATDTLYTKSRAFYGEVFKDTMGVVWYEQNLLEKGGYGNSIFLTRVHDYEKEDTLFDDDGKYLSRTLSLMKEGKCKEIKGLDLKSEP